MKAVRPFEPRRGSTLVEQPQFLCRNISGKRFMRLPILPLVLKLSIVLVYDHG